MTLLDLQVIGRQIKKKKDSKPKSQKSRPKAAAKKAANKKPSKATKPSKARPKAKNASNAGKKMKPSHEQVERMCKESRCEPGYLLDCLKNEVDCQNKSFAQCLKMLKDTPARKKTQTMKQVYRELQKYPAQQLWKDVQCLVKEHPDEHVPPYMLPIDDMSPQAISPKSYRSSNSKANRSADKSQRSENSKHSLRMDQGFPADLIAKSERSHNSERSQRAENSKHSARMLSDPDVPAELIAKSERSQRAANSKHSSRLVSDPYQELPAEVIAKIEEHM
jgi:hypothetical protein